MEYKCVIEKHKDASIYEKMPTRQLLKLFREVSDRSTLSCADWCDNLKKCEQNAEYNRALIKSVLDNRPHVPNKIESKAIRKAKIKKGK